MNTFFLQSKSFFKQHLKNAVLFTYFLIVYSNEEQEYLTVPFWGWGGTERGTYRHVGGLASARR